MIARCLLGATVGLLLLACGESLEQQQIEGRTMGTTYTVKFRPAPADRSASGLQTEIDAILTRVNRVMSTYDKESELSRFNRNPSTGWVEISRELFVVVAAALEISRLSEGAFDITVGPLVNLWGFGPDRGDDQLPSEADLAAAKALTGYSQLQLRVDPPALKKAQAGIYVDLSAIAKGYGVDQVVGYLDSLQIPNYLVEIGGELRVKGYNAQDKPWTLAIEKPTPDARSVAEIMHITDRSVATSGDYRNFFEIDGTRYSHAIDPSTGWPVVHQLASVTVVDDTCMLADAWATALLVLGPERGRQIAEQQGLAAFFIEIQKDGFAEQATPAFQSLLTQ